MRVVRLRYVHSDPLFYMSPLQVVPAGNLESAQLLAQGAACCGFVPITLASKYGLPVVPRVAIFSDGAVMSSRLFRGSGSGYAAVEDTTVSALALRIVYNLDFTRVPSLDGALEKFGGVLVIGDEALRLVAAGVPHIVDVGEAWREKFGRPLIYAVFAASPKATRKEVITAVEAVENSVATFYENPRPVVDSAARRLGLPRPLLEQYFAAVKYLMNRRAVEGLYFQSEAMGLKITYFD